MDEFNRNQNMNKDNMILFFSQVQTFNTDSYRMCHPIRGMLTRKKLNIIILGKNCIYTFLSVMIIRMKKNGTT